MKAINFSLLLNIIEKQLNEASNEKLKKAIKMLKYNKASFDIEAKVLKIAYPLTEFKNKSGICISKKWGIITH